MTINHFYLPINNVITGDLLLSESTTVYLLYAIEMVVGVRDKWDTGKTGKEVWNEKKERAER